VGQAVDYYFFYGPELNRVVSDYRRLTGAAPLFPKWAYGYWQCRERYHSQQEILDTAAEFRKRKIPVDVLVQDWLYWGQVRMERESSSTRSGIRDQRRWWINCTRTIYTC
jgi:alpha-D-xyloside xylohydrolase